MSKLLTVIAIVLLATSSAYGADTDYESVLTEARSLAKAGNPQAAARLCLEAANAMPAGGSTTSITACTTEVSVDGPGRDVLLAYALVWNGSPEKDAITQFLKVSNNFSTSKAAPDALLHVGYLRDQSGEDSGTELERLVRDYPSTKEAAEALHCLGHQALRHGDPLLAIQRFKDAAVVPEGKPDCGTESLVEAGYACISQYWKTGDTQSLSQALAIFLPLVQKTGSQQWGVRARLGRGEAYLIQGFGKEAADEYQAALDLHPTDPYLLGVAEYEMGCALYAKQDWIGSEAALSRFLDNRAGQTLLEKYELWKQARPGYRDYVATDPAKAAGLSGLELVPSAAYWRASALVKQKRYQEAKILLNEIRSSFGSLSIAEKADDLSKLCNYVLGEDKR